ncbi:MAG: hypothetical protein BMS9Abin37_0699 [Acidobacteriota bacterium]|nr:MAG: hypothetical protein BMS9Abin37_0699 [Acidobacteriota bacterium]
MQSDLMDRLFVSLVKRASLERLALRALLRANELLGFALGVRLAELRDAEEPIQTVFAQSETNALHARLFHEIADILAARWDKIPDKRRPQYSPEMRYRILRIKKLFALSAAETARSFRVAPGTVSRWERESASDQPDAERCPLVKPDPPVRRYADVVRQLVHSMRLCGFGGYDKIAQTLARAGWKLSKRTVGRILREKPPRGNPAQSCDSKTARAVRARFPNHVFLIDLTEIPSLFGLFHFKLAVIFDAFSRFPIGARVFPQEPTAEAIVQLFRNSVQRFGLPRHVVTDQGSQFTAKCFRDALTNAGVRQRFGAIGKVGSIALIERFWRSLKHSLALKHFKPLVLRELEKRVELGLLYYAFLRPHQSLGGATPAEVYLGPERAHLRAIPPPRALPHQGPIESHIEIVYLDPERRLPFLLNTAA